MGATTNNPKTKAIKLYSPHLPFGHIDEQWMKIYRNSGFCGKESGVYVIQEHYLDEAMKIASEQNITCEPSSIAGLALLLQIKESIKPDAKILIVNTGKVKV